MKKIITIAALAFACGRLPAAKMCVRTSYGVNAHNDEDYSWVIGGECGGTDDKNGGLKTTNTYSGTGAPSGWCSSVHTAGISACLSAPNGLYKGGKAGDGQYCHCKITYPMTGVWVYASNGAFGVPPGTNGCIATCASFCSHYMRLATTPLRSLMLAPKIDSI